MILARLLYSHRNSENDAINKNCEDTRESTQHNSNILKNFCNTCKLFFYTIITLYGRRFCSFDSMTYFTFSLYVHVVTLKHGFFICML